MPPRCPSDRPEALVRSRGAYLVIRDENTPPAERGRSIHQRLRPRARRVEREPEPPQIPQPLLSGDTDTVIPVS
jgi:hypothetical protein